MNGIARWLVPALLTAGTLLSPLPAQGEDVVTPLSIEGYTGQLSYRPGETVDVSHLDNGRALRLEISRLALRPKLDAHGGRPAGARRTRSRRTPRRTAAAGRSRTS